VDGYVSLEVPPDVAYDAAATVALARRLHEQAGSPHLLVKIPGTPQGLTTMEDTITAGIGVNVTLLFSDSHYLRTSDAYIRALLRRRDAGLDLAVPSVASMFISRWDSAADPLLPPALHGLLGLAMAQKAYSSHLQLLSDKALAGTRRSRRASATTAVGIHLDQERRSSRPLLSGPPGRPQHHRHRPGKDTARLRRPWNPG
jgi:transaldolase